MPTISQTATDRPIAFIFHDMAEGSAPVVVPLVIRPEDLTRTDMSRLAVAQTLKGGWVDSWGAGLPAVQISGTTGWGQANRPDGFSQFQKLYATVYLGWHDARAAQVKKGGDPNKVKLLFADALDGFVWVIAPQQFQLRRSKSRSQLYQYQIAFVQISNDVNDTLQAIQSKAAQQAAGLTSLQNALAKIQSFAKDLQSGIISVLGPLQSAIADFTNLTADVLNFVTGAIKAGTGLTGQLLNIATNLCRAASNIVNTVRSVVSLPAVLAGRFGMVSSAFQNAYCILSNLWAGTSLYPNYADLYGTANCASTASTPTAGVSLYDLPGANPFPALTAIPPGVPVYSANGILSLNTLSTYDPVATTMTQTEMIKHMNNVTSGIKSP